MKKKFLPFMLGCAMIATPFAANAQVNYHVGTDIVNKTSTNTGDVTTNPTPGYGHNEFTEHNDGSLTNTLAQVFGTPTTAADRSVTWTASTLGNTRNSTETTQGEYPVAIKNEARTETDVQGNTPAQNLAADIADTTFGETTNDCFGANYNPATNPLNNTGYTDLETAIPEFNMTIPAKTVLPIGATAWKLGQVEMNGHYFVNPDKIGLIISKKDFVRQSGESDVSNPDQQRDIINYGIYDAASSGNDLVTTLINGKIPDRTQRGTAAAKIWEFHRNGTKSNTFPYAYSNYSSTDYDGGKIADINEAKDLWLICSDWQNKNAGAYKGAVTFTAYVINGSLVEQTSGADDYHTAPYPQTIDGQESSSGANDGWYDDQVPQP